MIETIIIATTGALVALALIGVDKGDLRRMVPKRGARGRFVGR